MEEEKAERYKGNKRALVIAVSEYDSSNLRPIKFCENDGQEMYNVLRKVGYEIPKNCKLIGNVKSQELKEAIYSFFTNNENSPDDTLVFYYSGHGVPDKWGAIFLAPSDIDSDRPFMTGFSFTDLTNSMLECNSLRVVTILDSCYSGSLKLSKGLDSKSGEEAATRLANKEVDEKGDKLKQGVGRCLLASSQGYEEAYDRMEKDHSIFTYYLLEALNGHKDAVNDEGNVTYDLVGRFISREIGRLPPERRPNQTPIRKGEVSGGDIVLAHYTKQEVETKPVEKRSASDLAYLQALERIEAKDYTYALSCLDKAIKIDPKNAKAYFHQGNTFAKLAKYQEATKSYQKASEIDPNPYYASASRLLARYIKQKEREDELEPFDVHKMILDDVESTTKEADALLNLGKYNEAIECYDKVIKINSNHAGAWNNKGLALGNLGKYNEAIECYDKVIEINSNHAGAWNNKGQALGNLGKYNEAIECYDKVIEIDHDNADAINAKGLALDGLGNHTVAIPYYDKATELYAKRVNKLNEKGTSLIELCKFNEATSCFDEAIKIDANNGLAWLNKGNALNYSNQYNEAIECYDKVIEIDPDNADAINAKGLALVNAGKCNEAIKCYDKVLKIDPDNAFALQELHLIYSNYTYDFDQALLTAYKLLENQPTWKNKARLAEDLVKIGRYNEGRKVAIQALSTIPPDQVKGQSILRFLVLSSYLLKGDSKNGNKELVTFLDYYKKLEDDFRIEETEWVFNGWDASAHSNASIDEKAILMSIINLLQAKAEEKGTVATRLASQFPTRIRRKLRFLGR
jgi:tetratricopeptide (TPR) repeat protein